MKYDVFVSYSRKDKQVVDEICRVMNSHEIEYFIDTSDISGGSEFFNKIATAILNSTVFLYIGSRNSYNSIYTPKEVNFAIEEKRNIIPYLIDDCDVPKNLKLAFADLNVREKNKHSIQTIISDIEIILPPKFNKKFQDIDDIAYFPKYDQALKNYEYAHRLWYDDRFDNEGYINMRKAALAAAKRSELQGYIEKSKLLSNNIIDDYPELKDFYDSQEFKEKERLVLSEYETLLNERQIIIEKIKKGIPIVSIKFADELYNDKES